MQTTSRKTLSTQAILLSLCVSWLLFGCSTKHQKSATITGYYPSHKSGATYNPSGGSYSLPDPDRVNGSEAMHRATLKPYTVFGVRYYPDIKYIGFKEYGIASWYGPDFHGKKTSNGEIYNMYAPATAAHKTLPMNTIVKVTHRETGESVKVRINDRGPFVKGRIIDLSYTAGKALGLDKSGIAPVELEVLSFDDHIASRAGVAPKTAVAQNEVLPLEEPKPKLDQPKSDSLYAIQLGSFKSLESAEELKKRTTKKANGRNVTIKTVEVNSEQYHRVIIKGFGSIDEANRFKEEQGYDQATIISASKG